MRSTTTRIHLVLYCTYYTSVINTRDYIYRTYTRMYEKNSRTFIRVVCILVYIIRRPRFPLVILVDDRFAYTHETAYTVAHPPITIIGIVFV